MGRIPIFWGSNSWNGWSSAPRNPRPKGYPPFNIEAVAENAYRITLAVAGFREDDLAITVEDRQLVVRGRQAEDEGDRVFLHRGIAARAFQRSFVLADGVEVAGASMEHGLLHVDLRRSVPETVVQTIRIGAREKEDAT